MRVHLVQPVIPHYRVCFFRSLARALDGRLAIWAAPDAPGAPSSVPEAELSGLDVDLRSRFLPLLGGQFSRQAGLAGIFDADPDVLVLCGNARYVSNLPLIADARRRGTGVVWWGHAASSTSTVAGSTVRRMLMRTVDAVLVYTDAERDRLAARGIAPERLFYTNNALPLAGIDSARRAVTDEGLADWRGRLGLRPGDEVLLFTGRLSRKAGVGVLVDALARLAPSRPRLRAVLVGDGEEGDAIRASARDRGLADRLILTGELYDDGDLAHLFALADCYVYPGAVGLSILHSLYHGVPVVIHGDRRRHNPEADAFREGINGVSFRRGDPESLARTLDLLLDDRPMLDRLRSAARDSVVPRFTIETMVEGFLSACAFAAGQRGRGTANRQVSCAR